MILLRLQSTQSIFFSSLLILISKLSLSYKQHPAENNLSFFITVIEAPISFDSNKYLYHMVAKREEGYLAALPVYDSGNQRVALELGSPKRSNKGSTSKTRHKRTKQEKEL